MLTKWCCLPVCSFNVSLRHQMVCLLFFKRAEWSMMQLALPLNLMGSLKSLGWLMLCQKLWIFLPVSEKKCFAVLWQNIYTYPSSDLILLHIRSFAALFPHFTLGSSITEHFIIFAFFILVDPVWVVWVFFIFALFFSGLCFLPPKSFFLC